MGLGGRSLWPYGGRHGGITGGGRAGPERGNGSKWAGGRPISYAGAQFSTCRVNTFHRVVNNEEAKPAGHGSRALHLGLRPNSAGHGDPTLQMRQKRRSREGA
jgi:hypothetical protein